MSMRATGRTIGTRAMSMFTRGLHNAADDSTMMQQGQLSGLAGQAAKSIERMQNYGFTSTPLPPNEGGGESTGNPMTDAGWGAEHIMASLGGNQSHQVMLGVDDRRHRPRGLKPGENFQYDHFGQGTYNSLKGAFVMAGGKDNASQRYGSLRHVSKQQQPFSQSGGQSGGGRGSGGSGGQQQDYDHTGGSASAEHAVAQGSAETTGQDQIMHSVGSDATAHLDQKHVHIRFSDNNVVWADKEGLWSTKPIQQKPFPYKVSSKIPQGGGGGGGGGTGIDSGLDVGFEFCPPFIPKPPSVFDRIKSGMAFGLGVSLVIFTFFGTMSLVVPKLDNSAYAQRIPTR